MKLYHRTDSVAAEAIEADGFEDTEGYYMTRNLYRGVWFADRVLDDSLGISGQVCFVLDLPEALAEEYEWVGADTGYREFLIPADLVNGYSRQRVELDD